MAEPWAGDWAVLLVGGMADWTVDWTVFWMAVLRECARAYKWVASMDVGRVDWKDVWSVV